MEKCFSIDIDKLVEVDFFDGEKIFNIEFDNEIMMKVFNDFSTREAKVENYLEYCNALKKDLIMDLLYDAQENIYNFHVNKALKKKSIMSYIM